MDSRKPGELDIDLEKLKLKIQEEGSVPCPLAGCNETFKSVWGLRFHLKKKACNSSIFRCHKCNKAFPTRIVLQQHCNGCSDQGIEVVQQDIPSTSGNLTQKPGLKRLPDPSQEVHTSLNKKSKTSESIEEDSAVMFSTLSENAADGSLETLNVNTLEPSDSLQVNSTVETTLQYHPNTSSTKTVDTDIGQNHRQNTTISNLSTPHYELNISDTCTQGADVNIPMNTKTSHHHCKEAPKKKRGRPRKSDANTEKSPALQTKKHHQEDSAAPSPKKKQQKSQNTLSETLQSKNVVASRRSSRSTVRRVNYAQFDAGDENDYDDDDDDDDDDENKTVQVKASGDEALSIVKDVGKSKPCQHLTKGNICSLDEEQNQGNEISLDNTASIHKQRTSPHCSTPLVVMDAEKSQPETVIVGSDASQPNSVHLIDNNKNKSYTEQEETSPKRDKHHSVLEDCNSTLTATDINLSNSEGGSSKKVGFSQNEGNKIVDNSKIETYKPTNDNKTGKRRVGRPRKHPIDSGVQIEGDSIRVEKTGDFNLLPTNDNKIPKRRVGRPRKHPIDSGDQIGGDSNRVEKTEGDLNLLPTNDNKIPKRRVGRPKKIVLMAANNKTEQELLDLTLRNKAKKGQKISCPNQCGKKFTTFLGYKTHFNICGKSLEERQILTCEHCQREYKTKEGLRYHIRTIHEEQEVVTPKKDKPINDEADYVAGDATKRPRKAAARAMEKVQDLKKDWPSTVVTNPKSSQCRSVILDKYIIKFREGLVTPALINLWKDQIKKNGSMCCPNQDCNGEFTSHFVLHTHYLQCGFEENPFRCKICDKEFQTLIGIRHHIDTSHQLEGDKNSDDADDDDKEATYDTDHESESDDEEDSNVEDEIPEEQEVQEVKQIITKSSKEKKFHEISIPVGRHNKTCREYELWRNKNFAKEICFSEHLPMLDQWRRVETSKIHEYIPTSSLSPHFLIQRATNDATQKTDEMQLPLFRSLPKDEGGNYGDRIFYSGGPVWGLSWCPTPDTESSADQYLAVSTHRDYEAVYHISKCFKDKGTLQIWNIGPLTNGSSRSGDSAKLALCILHTFGPVWKLSWCPTGGWQSPDTAVNENAVPRLGLLALACGDGIVRILSIPHPEKLLSGLPVEFNSEHGEELNNVYNKVMVHATSAIDLYPCSVNVKYEGQRGMTTCIDWSQVRPFNKVAAGYSDGSVVVWNLASQSSLLRKPMENEQRTLRMAPFALFKADKVLIRDLAWCPVHQDIIVTSGHERNYKIWDLKASLSPLFLQRKGYVCEIEWPLRIKGFYYGEQEFYHKEQPSLRYCNLSAITDSVHVICHQGCSLMSLSYNDWINIVATSNIAGDVFLSKILAKKPPVNKWCIYKTHLEERNVDVDDKEAAATNDAGSKNANDDRTGDEASSTNHAVDSHVESADVKMVTENDEEAKKAGDEKPKLEGDVLKQKCPSLKDAIRTSRLVFQDKNILQFQKMLSTNEKDCQEQATSYRYNESTLQSIHRVRWNTNKQALTWIASGGASGLVRIHHVKEVKSRDLTS